MIFCNGNLETTSKLLKTSLGGVLYFYTLFSTILNWEMEKKIMAAIFKSVFTEVKPNLRWT